ncbi:MAG: redoxin family protein [Candidatus Latescibacterota bacterium]|jgi:thiol-disulfide isomerase/thioredoxin
MLGSALVILLLATATALHADSPGSAQEPAAPPATLTMADSSTDSVLVMTLTLVRESFVDIGIFDRLGMAVDAPMHRPMPAGQHVIRYEQTRLIPGSYVALLTLDHANKILLKGFTHFDGLPTATNSIEEKALLQGIAVYTSQAEPARALAAFDTLVHRYPHYLDKGAAYYSVLPVLAAQGDSARILAAADSVARYLPRAVYFREISQATARYPATALRYAQLALSVVDRVPLRYQDDERFWILLDLGDLYSRCSDPEAAKTSLEQALSVYHRLLPPTSRWVMVRKDRAIYRMLADLSEQRGDNEGALRWREKAVAKDAPDSWLELQRTYSLAYGTDTGYAQYSRVLDQALPAGPAQAAAIPPPSSGPFPDFELPVLDGGRLSLADLKESPVVVVFWGYWCGSCLKEMSYVQQLVDQHGSKGLKAVAIHGKFLPQLSEEDQLRYVRRALSRSGVSFPTVFDDQSELYNRLEIAATPTTYLLDRTGAILLKIEGYNAEALSSAVDRLLTP